MAENTPPLYELRRNLAASLDGKKVLYLALLYWNYLCDVVLGEREDAEHVALLGDLREKAIAGRVVCPIEYTIFVELHKQRLPEKRQATAHVIDELSAGVVMVSPPDRLFLEVLRLVQAILARKTFPQAPRDEVWTKPAFLVGHGELKSSTLKPDDLARINALLRTKLWEMGFTEVLEQLGDDLTVSFDRAERVASDLNERKVEAREGFASFRDVYLAEVRGVLDASAPELGNVFRYLFDRAGGDAESVSWLQQEDSGTSFARLLSAAFEQRDLSKHLPSVHVPATLYANVQWDGPRRFRANDIQDFSPAAAALAYCDAFATERPLAALIKQAKLTKTYAAAVLQSVSEVRAWLSSDAT
jgi:hypothetical protein